QQAKILHLWLDSSKTKLWNSRASAKCRNLARIRAIDLAFSCWFGLSKVVSPGRPGPIRRELRGATRGATPSPSRPCAHLHAFNQLDGGLRLFKSVAAPSTRRNEMAEAKTYQGGCHCGKVRYQVVTDPGEAIACNCSQCAKHGLWLTFASPEN